ncbi:hypothetical protein GCM10023340_09940 [Nocardioides marinquilinus]|uniref:Bacterial repeat domain-containing protein n=1 Tax=Nocardioides marinquilinus TaxID=1210400 RepID=A0ABP9PC57_9ACTN
MNLARMRPLLLAAVGALALSPLLLPAQADAGQVGISLTIQGAGQVTVVQGELNDGADPVCDRSDNLDDREGAECPRVRSESFLEAYVALAPVETVPGYTFAGWSGCQDVENRGGTPTCVMRSDAFNGKNYSVTARFKQAPATIRDLQAGVDAAGRVTVGFTHDGVASFCAVSPTIDWTPCSSGDAWAVPEGEHSVYVAGVNRSGNWGPATVSSSVWVVDTELTSAPAALTTSREATFSWTTRAGTSFECSVDGAPWRTCASGRSGSETITGLTDGQHTYRVRARKGEFVDAAPVSHTWAVDATAPVVSLGTPSVTGARATVGLSTDDATRVECRLSSTPADPADHGFRPCGSPVVYEALTDGRHDLEVRAFDVAGNVSAPATTAWTTDTTAPDVRLTGGPAEGSFSLAPTATFTATADSDASLRCTLDGRGLPCGSTLALTGLKPGTHVLEVGAVDAAGNADPTPAVRSWTVAETARAFARKGAWKAVRTGSAYGGTALTTTQKGATLTRSVRGARQVALVVGGTRAGSKAGTVAVYAGRTLLGTVRLTGTPTGKRLVTLKALGRPFTGTLSVRVTSTGRPVRVEGVAVRTR